MDSYKNFKKRTERIIDSVIREKRTHGSFTYWALCLDDSRTSPREVDTCATSLCVSILQMHKQIDKHENNEQVIDAIKGGVNTLVKIRKNDGSWPSIVKPNGIENSHADADVDVGLIDSFFAVSALLDVGFLCADFELSLFDAALSDLDKRAQFMIETINWFLKNKSSDGVGWGNTYSQSKDQDCTALLATTNTITILKRVADDLSRIGEEKYNAIISDINSTIKTSVGGMILERHSDGGIGYVISPDDELQSSLPHTCRLVDILVLDNDETNITELQESLNYILAHGTADKILSNRAKSANCYIEQYNLRLGKEGEICIQHEHCIECMVLLTLINILIKYRTVRNVCTKLSFTEFEILKLINELMSTLKTVQKNSGKYNGTFKSFVDRAEGNYPVYASYYGYKSVQQYSELYNMLCQSPVEIKNDLTVTCNSLLYKFKTAVRRYGSNESNATVILQLERYISKLQEIEEKLTTPISDEDRLNIERDFNAMKHYYKNNIGDE